MKKIIIIISATILIIILLLIIDKYTDNYILESEVKQGIESLSDEAKNKLNYDELLIDIKAKARGKELIYASEIDHDDVPGFYFCSYRGEGYYYISDVGCDVIGYAFVSSVDDKCIYSSETAVPIETQQQQYIRCIREFIRENIIGDIIIIIAIISGISCIMIYHKEKRTIKNDNFSKFK